MFRLASAFNLKEALKTLTVLVCGVYITGAFSQKIAPPLGAETKNKNKDAVEALFQAVPQNAIENGTIESNENSLGISSYSSREESGKNKDLERQRKEFLMRGSDKEVSGAATLESKSAEKLRQLDKQMGLTTPLTGENDNRLPSFLLGLKKIRGLYSLKQFEETLFEVNQLLKSYPRSHVLFLMKGTVALKLSQLDLALKCYKRAFVLEPSAKLNAQIKSLEQKISERESLRMRQSTPSKVANENLSENLGVTSPVPEPSPTKTEKPSEAHGGKSDLDIITDEFLKEEVK